LGYLLWYIAALAEKYNLTLSEIAEANLHKTTARWGTSANGTELLYDELYLEHEKFPRQFTVKFSEIDVDGHPRVVMHIDGDAFGDKLTDNALQEDNYRYHDAFHLAFLSVLGWSPVLRKLMGKKRRSDPKIDETEDGGRAIVIEEGIAAYLFEYGETHNRLHGVKAVDFDVLKTVKNMTQRLEVRTKNWADWEGAIMQGYEVFRLLSDNHGGLVRCDLEAKRIEYVSE
jgi:hypothetical protein